MKITEKTRYVMVLDEQEIQVLWEAINVAWIAVNGKWQMGMDLRYQQYIPQWSHMNDEIREAQER